MRSFPIGVITVCSFSPYTGSWSTLLKCHLSCEMSLNWTGYLIDMQPRVLCCEKEANSLLHLIQSKICGTVVAVKRKLAEQFICLWKFVFENWVMRGCRQNINNSVITNAYSGNQFYKQKIERNVEKMAAIPTLISQWTIDFTTWFISPWTLRCIPKVDTIRTQWIYLSDPSQNAFLWSLGKKLIISKIFLFQLQKCGKCIGFLFREKYRKTNE